MGTAPASAREALDMVRAGLGYLAAADAARLGTAAQAECLRELERDAAVGHSAWAKRTGTHPRVVAALAGGQVSEPAGRVICLWTGKLPER